MVFLGRIQVPADVLHVHSGVLAPHSSMGCDCSARASLYASASAKLRAMLARKFCVCRHGIAVSLALFLTCNQHSGNERACMIGGVSAIRRINRARPADGVTMVSPG